MKKARLILMGTSMLALASCGGNGGTPAASSAASSSTSSSASSEVSSEASSATSAEKDFVVGVSQWARHPALDAATNAFKAKLIEELGSHVTFIDGVANGDISVAQLIVNNFISNNVDLILANATPCLQIASYATETIPVLGTSITDYGVALDMPVPEGVVGGNISGTSDLAPLDEQAAMIKEFFPDIQKVGLFYCSAEANSVFQVNSVASYLHEMNIQTEVFTFSDSNDISMVLSGALSACDALYIPTDNTCADNAELIGSYAIDAGKPIFAGEENICKGCGIATLSISYEKIGTITGEMAVEILRDGADISEMAIRYDDSSVKKYNKEMCDALGITDIPEGYIELE